MYNILCPSCKTPAPPGAIFCDNCGYDLRAVTAVNEQPLRTDYPTPAMSSNELICSNCKNPNAAGSLFCENCGAQLIQKRADIEPVADLPAAQPPSSMLDEAVPGEPTGSNIEQPASEFVIGRLVIQNLNVTLFIPPNSRSVMIGREDPVSGIFPEIDLDPHGGHEAGVGRRHAQLFQQDGQVYIEDLDSVNGTSLNKQRLEPHKPRIVSEGDELRFGKMVLTYFSK